MTDIKIQKLSQKARDIMSASIDPIHDLDHINRVLNNAKKIMTSFNLSEKDKQAVELACLWHDTGRTITSKPSFVWMVFFDDMISALLLWKESIKYHLFGGTAGMASRIILCKSLGTGRVFTKIFLRKKTRLLLDIVKDADTLDVIHTERLKKIMLAIESNTMPVITYRIVSWYATRLKTFKIKTIIARRILKQIIEQMLQWLHKPEIAYLHIRILGEKSCYKLEAKIKNLLNHLSSSILKQTYA